jgi:hypothetical protein
MVMMERFGSPATRWMSVMKSFQVPVRSIQPGDRILVSTDDAMDPLVWQGAMAALTEKGADRGKIVSVLRLEGIIEKITMIIDDTVVCDSGKILV